MAIAQVGFAVLGVVVLVIGYRKSRRSMMTVGAVLIVLAYRIPDVIEGFREGSTRAYNELERTDQSPRD